MFEEVFGGIDIGAIDDKKKCPCGCVCMCWEGEEQRVSNTNSRTSTVHAGSFATTPD